MANSIRNNLQNVTIGGNFVGGNQTIHHHHRGTASTAAEENAASTPKEATVFLSYRRTNSDTADSIDRRLSEAGLIVKRDIRDIPRWKSIRAFMQSIRDQDVAVLLISDEYLKSHACMYEVMEIMKEKNYHGRILSVVIEHGIYNKEKRAEYIAHWQRETEQYKAAMHAIEPENQAGMPEELRQMKHIAASIGEFLQTVADMNNPDISDAGDAIIAHLKHRNLLPSTMNNEPSVNNHISEAQIGRNFIGGDCITNHYHQPSAPEPRGFIVTHTSDIKPTSHFMGRESELAHLRTNAEEGRKSILVSGMGGIGKTHICRRLFQEYHARHLRKETVPFRHIGYIQYDGNMDASLVSCLIYPKPADQAAQVEAAWRELALLADKGLLLFVDNVSNSIGDDPSLQKLCSLPSPVILTSRLKYFDSQNTFELYSIDSLPLEECRKLYLQITGDTPDHQQALDEILDIRAARHTLTVELLARTAASNEWSIPTLLDKLKSNGFRITYEDGDQTVALMDAYEKLFILSALNDAEINILEAFSLFPYLPLHKDTCTAWLLPDAGEKADGSIFQKLHRKGWLQHEKNAGYMIHPILSQFVRERQKPSWLRHSAVVAAVWQAIDIPDNGCRPFLPFSESLIAQLDEIPQQTNADLLNALGYTLHRIGAYTRALPLFEKALRIREDALGDSHPDTVISYNNLASLYNCQGDYTRAQPFYEKALQIREDALGECHPDTATSYNNLAGLYNSQGDDERAKSLYEKALRIREAALGDGHPDTAASYNNLALLYKNQENYAQAQTLYEKALRISEACLGENHPDTATSYNNLASLYDSQGDYTRAQPFYEKALRIREDAFGENHPDTAASYNNLASLYYGQDNYDKASPLFQKALNICRDILGEQHPTTRTILENANYCLYRQSGAACSFEEWLEQQVPPTEE